MRTLDLASARIGALAATTTSRATSLSPATVPATSSGTSTIRSPSAA